jgi:pyruvate dehydrogenase (quinone)
VPPLPPHISFEQAANFMESLVKGDTDERGIVASAARQVLANVLPGQKD